MSNKFLNQIVCESFNNKKKKCYNVSSKLSTSLIRVASTRIFNDPYRSILELPVNSIDSYRRISNKKKYPEIGKFGMGFFSILYWIVSSKRKVIIISKTDKESYKAVLFSKKDQIYLKVDKTYEREEGNGTTVIINAEKEPFKFIEIKRFKKHLYSLFDIKDVLITYKFITVQNINNVSKKLPRVDIVINEGNGKNIFNFIEIKDYAEGISLNTFYKKLLAPSISTKTIQMSNKNTKFKDNTRYDENIDFHHKGFFITVNDVAVYSDTFINHNDFNLIGAYILTFPPNTSLPVSRDDILIDNVDDFFNKIIDLAESVIESIQDLTILFYFLDRYSDYTSQQKLQDTIYEAKRYILSWDEFYVPSDNIIFDKIKYLLGDKEPVIIPNPDLKKLEDKIIKELPGKSGIFEGKRVVFIKNLDKSSIGSSGLPSYLFVPKSIKKEKDWKINLASSYDKERLILIGDFSSEKLKSYFDSVIDNILENSLNYKLVTYKRVIKRTYTKEIFPLFTLIWSIFNSNKEYVKERMEHVIRYILHTSFSLHGRSAKLAKTRTLTYINYVYNSFSKKEIVKEYGMKKNVRFFIPESHFFPSSLKNIRGIKIEIKKYEHDEYELRGKNMRKLEYEYSIWTVLNQFKNNSLVYSRPLNFTRIKNITSDIIEKLITELKRFIVHPMIIYLYISGLVGFMSNIFFKNTLEEVIESIETLVYEMKNKFPTGVLIKLYFKTYALNIQFFTPFLLTLEYILNGINNVSKYMPLVKGKKKTKNFSFKAKNLLKLIFDRNINTEEPLTWMKEAENRINNKVNFQALEIAINEGTSKDFIGSIFTELIQNSIDAIRSSEKPQKHNIEISINKDMLSVFDTVGIPDKGLLAILIPFLSTKTSESLISTGEMGTGFFNVYRQPYSKRVLIETTNKYRSLIIEVDPIIKNDRVIDLIYSVKYSKPSKEIGTQITIFFNEDIDKIDIIIRAAMQMNILKLIEYPVIFNGDNINLDIPLIYESEIGKVFYDKENRFISHIFTNGVPFGEIKKYIHYFSNNYLPDIVSLGFIFDFKPGQFTPTQSRNKINLKNEDNIKHFMNEGLYWTIIRTISNGLNKEDLILTYMHLILPNFYSKADFMQVGYGIDNTVSYTRNNKKSEKRNNIKLKSFPVYKPKNYAHSIAGYINIISKKLMKVGEIPDDVIGDDYEMNEDLKNVINLWFSTKSFPINELEKRLKIKKSKSNKIVYNFFENFIESFWEIGLRLEKEGSIKGTKFRKNKEPPSLEFRTDMGKRTGYYSKKNHTITLRDIYLIDFKKDITKLLKTSNPGILIIDMNIKKLISIYPGSTLIHELCHAWRGSSHDTGIHGDIELTIYKKTKTYDFESASSKIFTVIVQNNVYGFLKH